MKEKLGKLMNSFSFVIAVVTLVLLVIDNREEIEECVKKLLQKESWINFVQDVSEVFAAYNAKVKRVYDKAKEILAA